MFLKNFLTTLCLLFIVQFFTKADEIHLGPGQQFANIQSAAAVLKPGDTVLLHAGQYSGYQALIDLKGTAEKPIVIRPFRNDEVEIGGMWQFSKCAFIHFENLVFKSDAKNGGRLFMVENGGSCETQSHHIIVDSCSFLNVTDPQNSAFKFAGVDFFEVTNCIFKDLASGAMDFNSCRDGIISQNRIENCLTGGHIKGGAERITMERNLFVNASQESWVAFELGGDTGTPYYCPGSKAEVDSLRFYSNIIIGGYRGLALSSAQNCEVINNTFYECSQATLRILTTSLTFPKVSGNKIYNNIFAFGAASQYMNGSPQSADAADFKSNIYYSTTSETFNGPYWDSPALDAVKEINPMNFGTQTPMFIAYDFHLREGSPAIAAGIVTSAPLKDFYGNDFHTKRSIGAAEFGDAPTAIFEVENQFLKTAQTSESGVFQIISDNDFSVEIFNSFGDRIPFKRMNSLIDISAQPVGVYIVCVAASRIKSAVTVLKF